MAAPATTHRIKQQAPPALTISGLFSVGSFLPLQTLPARRECKGMAATLEEGTAPKLVQVNASPVAGETIASRTAKAGNAPHGPTMGLARPIARKGPGGFQIRRKSTGRHLSENESSAGTAPEGEAGQHSRP